jgi:hypothetical protein
MTTYLYPRRRREEKAVVVNKRVKMRRVVRERRRRGEGNIIINVLNNLLRGANVLSLSESLFRICEYLVTT